jgi:hypothetical protein
VQFIVHGQAGTGKSFLISAIRDLMGEKCLTLAPTGVAAFNIGGSTIHHALHISICRFTELTGRLLQTLQNDLRNVSLIIIDEFSMISQWLLYAIDRRLKQAFPSCSNVPFGGRCVMLTGDLCQLKPAKGAALYVRSSRKATASGDQRSHPVICGSTLYLNCFRRVFFLDQLVRQASDPEFGEFLQRVREGKIEKPDFDLLMSRCVSNTDSLPADSTMLLATNRAVDALNRHRLHQRKSAANPVCIIKAMQSNRGEQQQELNQLQQQKSRAPLRLQIGARVMLLRNISVRHGLVNGAIGILRSICYQAGCKPLQLPTCVFVEFDGYSGPVLLDSDGHRVVPIMPMSSEAGTQLPLQLAWAITVHKSQGLTLKEAYFDFRSIVRASDGLVYTALTRVKRLVDLHVSWCSLAELTKFLKTTKPLIDELQRLREMSLK